MSVGNPDQSQAYVGLGKIPSSALCIGSGTLKEKFRDLAFYRRYGAICWKYEGI